MHVSVKVLLVDVSAPVLALPEVARLPLQPPLAVHALVLIDDQLSVALAPLFTVLGFAEIETVGAGGGALTVTLAV
ncbi:MAG: hypothetical protein KDI32_13980 [Pseudomonadales bacterium]|nr:hypothetical protein [Pseudomonadales bacterium]